VLCLLVPTGTGGGGGAVCTCAFAHLVCNGAIGTAIGQETRGTGSVDTERETQIGYLEWVFNFFRCVWGAMAAC